MGFFVAYPSFDEDDKRIEDCDITSWPWEETEYETFEAAKKECDKINKRAGKVVCLVVRVGG